MALVLVKTPHGALKSLDAQGHTRPDQGNLNFSGGIQLLEYSKGLGDIFKVRWRLRFLVQRQRDLCEEGGSQTEEMVCMVVTM